MQKLQFNKEIIVVDNSSRLPKFQTRTVIAEENGRKIVYKYASNPEALPFLKLIVGREKKNIDYLKEHFDVLGGTLKNERIEYEYIPHRSLLDVIVGHLRQNNYAAADGILRRYVGKVGSLEQVRTVPEEFLTLVGKDEYGCKQEMVCLRRGLLDLTPRNILVDGNRWIVLDNEWSFDFPLPMIFLLFRAIRELAMGLQREIRMCASVSNPAVGVFARGLQTYYVPKDWLKHITDVKINFSRLLQWEMGFQQFITGSFCDTVGRIKRYPRTRVHFSSKDMEADAGMLADATRLLKRIPGMRKLVHLLERKAAYLRK